MRYQSNGVVLCLFIYAILLTGCDTTVTVTAVSNQRIELGEKYNMHILKVNEREETTGIYTKNVYSSIDHFTYSFTLSPNKIVWEGKGAEPQHLLICQDDLYLHFLEKRLNPAYTQIDLAQASDDDLIDQKPKKEETVSRHTVGSYYSRHIDNRYFFRLLGEAYWVDVEPEIYNKKMNACKEYAIPNDNELVLDAPL